MVNINEFKVYCENIIANKTQSGNTITPVQFNIAAHRAQMMVFEKDRLMFLKTGESSDYIDWFLKTVTISPNQKTGYADYPKEYQHTAGVRSYYNGGERKVELVTNSAWGEIQQSVLEGPSLLYPKYTEFSGEYRFLPRNIGIVMLDYWKEPQKPFWAYTVVNNVAVYDPVNSVDFEWAQFALEMVADVYIGIIAQNIKDSQLAAYVDNQKKQNNSLL